MSDPAWLELRRALVDTGVFILWLGRYPYLRDHLADALIAASAWAKNLPLVTVNIPHFDPITEIEVVPFLIVYCTSNATAAILCSLCVGQSGNARTD